MDERRIERHLVNGVKKLGGMCIKFTSPGTPGVPDRIIITAAGRIIFAELKSETGRLSKIQRYIINDMQKHGADVRVVKGLDQVKELLAELDTENGKAVLLRIYQTLGESDRSKLLELARELGGEQN